jgi:hypothetical protein
MYLSRVGPEAVESGFALLARCKRASYTTFTLALPPFSIIWTSCSFPEMTEVVSIIWKKDGVISSIIFIMSRTGIKVDRPNKRYVNSKTTM